MVSLSLRISIALIISVVTGGCLTFSSGQQTQESISSVGEGTSQPTESQDQTIYQPIIHEYAPPVSIVEKTQTSTVIVIGQVKQDSRVINTRRNPDDITKWDTSALSLGQVYQVEIETVLKGEDLDSTLFFVHHEGFLRKPQASENPSPEDVELARKLESFQPFVSDHRYLLFLRPLRGFEKDNYYTGGFEPWRFDVTDGNNTFPQSPAPFNIPSLPLADLLKQIEAALTAPPEATVVSPLPTPQPVNTDVPALP